MSQTSGSRWEPNPDEQPTQQLGVEQPTAPSEPRRAGRIVAAVAVVVAATLAGGAVGAVLAGNRTAEVNDTAVVDRGATPDQAQPYWGGDDDGSGPRGDRHWFGGH